MGAILFIWEALPALQTVPLGTLFLLVDFFKKKYNQFCYKKLERGFRILRKRKNKRKEG